MRTRLLCVIGLSLVAAASLSLAAGRNLAVDAVTRATTWNEHEGEAVWLIDGRVPPDDTKAFVWNSKGILAFELGAVHTIDRVRIRVGDVANDYQVRAYLGGLLQEDGAARDPQGQQTARVDEFSRGSNGWVEIVLPAETLADTLALRNFGPARFFEVQILAPEATAVTELTWAGVKVHSEP